MKRFFLIFLEFAYNIAHILIMPLKGMLKLGSPSEKLMIQLEKVSKGILFDCQMCGQCILHSTGMVCPMTCPKTLRNGPCGGVRLNGHCEVKPDMKCIWVGVYENAIMSSKYGGEIMWVQPPVNCALENTSAWVNMLHGIDQKISVEWQNEHEKQKLEAIWRK